MIAEGRSASRSIAIAVGAGLAAGWLAIHLPGALSVRLAGDPVRFPALLIAILALGPLVLLGFLRRPGMALLVLVVAVWTNLSEVLVRFHGFPSLLQLVTIPILIAALWTSGESVVRLLRSPVFLAASAWLLWNGMSIFWALRPEIATDRMLELAKAWLIFVLVALLGAGLVRLRRASWAVVLSAAVLASLGIWQVLTRGFDQQFGGLARIKDAQIYGDVFEPRIAGPLGDPNFFAQILLMAVPVALALGWSSVGSRSDRRPGVRIASLLLAGVLLSGLLLTYSRGAAVALALVLAAALLVRGVRLRHLVAGGVLLLSVALIAPLGLVRRLETLGQILPGIHASESIHPDSSFAKRRLVTSTAWEVFTDHAVVGVGAGNYGEAFFDTSRRVGTDAVLYEDPGVRNYPHNLYLEIAAETGSIGVVLFGLMVVSAVATLWLVRRRATGRRQHALGALAEGFLLSLAGFLLTALFLHWEFPRYFELLLGLIAGLGLAASRSADDAGVFEVVESGSSVEGSDPEPLSDARPGPMDGPVAVVVSRFPKLTETFILREIDELERQGKPVVLVPLMREREAVIHDRAKPWLARAVFTPWASGEILRSNLSWMNRKTGVYLGTLARLILGSLSSPTTLLKSLAMYPKAAYLAERLPSQGVGHVHAHFATHPATLALIVHRLAGIDFSFTVHAHDIFVRRQLLAWKIEQARFVRVISEFNRGYLQQRFPGCEPKLRLIHMGLDVDTYDAVSRQRTEGRDHDPLILCIASLQEHKGVDRLIDACAELADAARRFRCRVIGEGPDRRPLERRVADLGLRAQVDLSGGATEEEVREAIADAAIVVQPSLVASDGQMEGIPVALMEAQASGRAVVASRLSGTPELIEHGVNGWLVDPGDTRMLTESLERLLADPRLRERLGAAARQSVRRGFALEDTAAALRKELMRCSQPPPTGWQALAGASLRPGERGGIARAIRSPDALTLEVVVAGDRSAHRRYVKQALDRPGASFPARLRAAREAATLRWLGALSDDRFGVPRLIATNGERAVVVTGECPGRRLDGLLREARGLRTSQALNALTPAVSAAGEWLCRFQALELPRLPGDDRSTDAPATRSADQTPTNSAVPNPVASHGDFWPGNIFVDEQERICAVDFEGIGRRSSYYDGAWFLAHLQRYLRRPWHAPVWSALREAFIDSWSGSEFDRDALNRAYRRAQSRMRALAAAGPDADGGQRLKPTRGIVLDSAAGQVR